MELSEEPSSLKVENGVDEDDDDGNLPSKVETDPYGEELGAEDEEGGEGGEGDGDDEDPVRGEGDVKGPYEKQRRKSNRVRKETVPLIREMTRPSKPAGNNAPRYRFFRPQKRMYKPSALVDRDWTIPEREKLLDAVSKVATDDCASIADIVGNTKTPAEVKDYIKRIQIRSKEIEGKRQNSLFETKREPHSRHLLVKEDGEAIERWLRVIDHLVSDNDTADLSKALPDVFSVIASLEQNPDPGTIRGKRKKPSEGGESSDAAQKQQQQQRGDDDDDDDDTAADKSDDAVAPINYKVIYEYIYALLRGLTPPPLDPIESWVVLDLISDTATELKGSDLEGQKEYLRCIYRDYCNKTLNLKWSSTSRMVVPVAEEIVVKRKRRKMGEGFASYLSKNNEKERGDDGQVRDDDGEGRDDKDDDDERQQQPPTTNSGLTESEPHSSESSASGAVIEMTPQFGDPYASIPDDPSYHNIMIGGLDVTKDAEDFGALFTMNPFGVPVSLFNPKKQD